MRHDLEGFIRAYLDAAGIGAENKDRPLFRSTQGKTKRLTGKPLTTKDVCRMVKRRLKDAGLPSRLSPHSFRVTGITDLLTQGVPLDDVQYLAGHSSPRTTEALRPAAEEGDAEHRGADFDLDNPWLTITLVGSNQTQHRGFDQGMRYASTGLRWLNA